MNRSLIEGSVVNTLLLMAIWDNNMQRLRKIVAKGGDLDKPIESVRFEKAQVPLLFAANKGNEEAVDILLGAGANLHTVLDGENALSMAIQGGHMELAKKLFKMGADPKVGDALRYAIRGQSAEVVKMCLDGGSDLQKVLDFYQNSHFPISTPDIITDETRQIVKYLVDAGLDINQTDKDGWGLTAFAVGNGDMVKFLCGIGANINEKTKCGNSLLHLAALNGHLDTVKILLDLGADKDTKNTHGKTPMDIALENGHLEIVKLIDSHNKKGQEIDGCCSFDLNF